MRILLINQAFHPDVVSTAQHTADLAAELARRGHDVTVVCSRNAYDSPKIRFARRECWNNVQIRRVDCLALGKNSKLVRGIVFASFLFNCAIELTRIRHADVVIAMTSPPLVSILGALFAKVNRGRFVFWVMDLNPDEAVAAGWLRQRSLVTALLSGFLRHSLREAHAVIVLDRFMRERIQNKGVPAEKIKVIPPWPHEDAVAYTDEGRTSFRARHGLTGKFVVMYSGNHSPCHPLETLLWAADKLSPREEIMFCFVGGGSEFRKVQSFARERGLRNILCLPYQPREALAGSLSAADLHVVVLGDPFVGIVHPCKIYNVLAIGLPVLYIGPSPSHITDIAAADQSQQCIYLSEHGKRDQVIIHIENALTRRTRHSHHLLSGFCQKTLMSQMCEVLEPVSGEFNGGASAELASR